jgi:acetyl esterase
MDPQVEGLLQMMAAQAAASGAPQTWEVPAAVARANAEQSFVAFNQPMPEGVTIADRTVPGPAGEIPVKVFTPAGPGPFPLAVYFHMGGFVIGSPSTQQKLCAGSPLPGAMFVSVDTVWRRSIRPLDDCVAAAP